MDKAKFEELGAEVECRGIEAEAFINVYEDAIGGFMTIRLKKQVSLKTPKREFKVEIVVHREIGSSYAEDQIESLVDGLLRDLEERANHFVYNRLDVFNRIIGGLRLVKGIPVTVKFLDHTDC